MRIQIATPAAPGSIAGNRVTAERWAGLLRQLGHDVRVTGLELEEADLLVALHARKSFPLVARAHAERPGMPVLVALTGTDLYEDLPHSPEARQSLEWAVRIVALQPLARNSVPAPVRERVRAILQSAEPPPERAEPDADRFEVAVLAHLRPVKDPLCAAEAARLLPASSRLCVTLVGSALSRAEEESARREEAENPRFRWLGGLPRVEALRVLSRARLLALTSRSEGGANVLSEALAAGVPVVSSRIDGSLGVLGEDYPGYFPAGDRAALAGLLRRAEGDREFYEELVRRCDERAPLVAPERERDAWRALLEELR